MCVSVLLKKRKRKKKRAAGSRRRKRWLVWSLQRTDASVAAAAQRHSDLRSSLTDTGVTTEEGANRLRPLVTRSKACRTRPVQHMAVMVINSTTSGSSPWYW